MNSAFTDLIRSLTHEYGFLHYMAVFDEPLVLIPGGYWTFQEFCGVSPPHWHKDVSWFTCAIAEGLIHRPQRTPSGSRDAFVITKAGKRFLMQRMQHLTEELRRDHDLISAYCGQRDQLQRRCDRLRTENHDAQRQLRSAEAKYCKHIFTLEERISQLEVQIQRHRRAGKS